MEDNTFDYLLMSEKAIYYVFLGKGSQQDNAGGSRKLSAVAAGHTMEVKERHYEKVGEDFEQVHKSYRKFHPAFVENW